MADSAELTTDSPTSPPALLEAPGFLVRRLYQAYVAAWVRSVDSSLTGPQFAVLTMVDSAPGRDQRSMASAVSLDASTMTDIVKRLEKRGLITRCTSTTDGRRKLLFLTDEGKDVLREANRLARALDEKLVGPYSPDQRAQLMQMLTDLADHWENLNKEP